MHTSYEMKGKPTLMTFALTSRVSLRQIMTIQAFNLNIQ